ncbi:sensor histidine kinase [Fluviicola taffensis]|uniref:Signal transduction histidine kinase, LytS n=1 Tax=Fluviicola taffensis (strain DSM 16823 / NCIMB 13979 / RW262) TaxID=755732 RepID=F2IIV9_FLUTR|nr:histidine kinase [Fluviicola taffensis]AEA42816.1 signal transduction histidine kinase, LytS [Fluviicola taffensis DSM 16823]
MRAFKVNSWLVFLFFFITCLNQKANAQPLGKLIESTLDYNSPFTIRVFGTEDGVPQHQISSMIRNKHGLLIIGTANGLVEFNGQSFSDINPTDESRKMLCGDLYIDEKTNILYGLDLKSRLYIISPYTKELFKDENQIAKMHHDSLIFITKKNEFRIAKIGSTKSRLISKISPQKTILGCGIADDTPFYSNLEGSFFLIKGKWVKLTNEIFSKSKKNQYTGQYYLLGVSSLTSFENGKLKIESFQENTADYLFTDIAFSPAGETFVSSHQGLFYRNKKHSLFESLNSNIPTKLILSLEYNTDENFLFAGTTNKGLFQIKEKSCISFFDESVLKESSLSSIVKNEQDELLISGTFSSIFALKNYSLSKYINFHTDFSTLATINGEIWAGTWGSGAFVIRNHQIIRQIKDPFYGAPILAMFQDRKKRIWIGSEDGLAVGTNEKSLKQIAKKQKIGLVICIYQLKNGDILVGGENGFYIFSEDLQLKNQIGIRNGLSGKEVRSFHEKEDGTFYIGTYGGGLYYWDNKKLLSINRMKNCLLDNDIFTLAPDKKGNLYISSNHGLYVINEKKMEDFIQHKINFLIPFRVGHDDGILNTEFNGGFQNNYFTPDNKHFYFPSIQGLVVCFLEIPKYRKLKPFLKEILVNDKIQKLSNHVFSRTTHTINLKFNCPNFTNFYNLYYQYKLVGPDLKEMWSVPTKKGEISFRMLPPGEYTVYMRGIDGFNDQNPREISYSFKIEKHIYETLWFRLVAFGLVFLLIFLLTYKRIQISKDQELKESEHKNTMFELKLKAIQAKMNPHFIFNCLNNIQYLIVMGKQEEAEFALSDFSGLLRKFLQQSDHSFITLRDEVELLKSYISVERFRFEEGLNVEVKIPENLLHLKIPTLLIQPTVENAIVHGLTHKKGDKKLIIKGYKENDSIILKIEDNGIGRQEAKRINTYRANHISHGWNMVLDKINLLKAKYQYSVIFEIIDKPDNSGTIVIFKIPLVLEEMLEN